MDLSKSPFPGMDPYLEKFWRDVHHRLCTYACDALQPQLRPALLAQIDERPIVESDAAEDRPIFPDVKVVQEHARLRPAGESAAKEFEGAVSVAEPPLLLSVGPETPTEGFINIIDPSDGNRLVNVIEFLSPSNKLPGEGHKQYRQKQVELKKGRRQPDRDRPHSHGRLDGAGSPGNGSACVSNPLSRLCAPRLARRRVRILSCPHQSAPSHRQYSASREGRRRQARRPAYSRSDLPQRCLRPHRLPRSTRPAPTKRSGRMDQRDAQSRSAMLTRTPPVHSVFRDCLTTSRSRAVSARFGGAPREFDARFLGRAVLKRLLGGLSATE
jgi:Protein of unknown function (DUF4058)